MNNRRILAQWLLFTFFGLFCVPLHADPLEDRILSLREQAKLTDSILANRLDTVVPEIMQRTGIDAWVIIAREYNEDPVLRTMLPATWLNARRRTVLIFLNQDDGRTAKRMAVARYAVGDLFEGVWDPEQQPDQWQRIAEILIEANPGKIALNYSDSYGHADGLTYSEHRDFLAALPAPMRDRIVSAESLAVGWLETRTEMEMETYTDVVSIAHAIIAEGFSGKVVKPGITTREDLVWWYRQRINDLGLQTWFHTSIDVQRSDQSAAEIETRKHDPEVLWPGDSLHIDFGISYLNLQTDTQQNAYILRPGETDVPEALKKALKDGNTVQDLLTGNFKVGRTGNEILRLTREQSLAAGIGPVIYTHPIGLHGHAAGTTIGMWDKQEGVPGSGDRQMHANTAYSIELTALVEIPEWSTEPMRMMLEEDGFFNGETFYYISPRQETYHIIRPE